MILVRRVEGVSMAPAYSHGTIVFAMRLFKQPKVGDVVIVRHHRVEVMKRVDQLDDDQMYLLGDNPQESTDSRHFGWLPTSALVAVVIASRPKQVVDAFDVDEENEAMQEGPGDEEPEDEDDAPEDADETLGQAEPEANS